MSRQNPLPLTFVGICFVLVTLAMTTGPIGMVTGQELPRGAAIPPGDSAGAVSCPTGHCPPGRCAIGSRLSPRRLDWNSRYVRRDLPPPGMSIHAMHATQIANAAATRMMLYQYDFHPHDPRLNPRGNWQLQKMSDRMQYHGFPILIEATTSRDLDEARRAQVLAVLQEANIPIDPADVLISRPLTRGIDGLDAIPIHTNLLRMSSDGQAGGALGGQGMAGPEGGMGGSSMGNTGR
jgi:hypothetical protein